MERHTECFLCISIFVILLPNIARPEDCIKILTASKGRLDSVFHVASGEPSLSPCRYFIRAPVDHYILLNITRLIGFTTERLQRRGDCLPRLVVTSASRTRTRKLRTICSRTEKLPLVVQSDSNELRLLFYGSSSEDSGFSATYTFHTKQVPNSLNLSLSSSRYPRDTTGTGSNGSEPNSESHHTPPNSEPRPSDDPVQLLEFLVLFILTPLAVFCMCAILIYRCRNRSSCLQASAMSGHNPGRANSQSDVTTVASNSPLLSGTSTFSAQQNQDMLRQQRMEVCRRSPSTEKYPVSIPLRDEDEPPHLRGQRLNPDVSTEHNLCREGVRGPPNRTVYDSGEMYSIDYHNIKQHPKTMGGHRKTEPVRTLYHQGPPLIPRSSDYIIDSITHSPIDMADSDEPPPPYSSVVSSRGTTPPVNNNLLNVCESSSTPRRGGRSPTGGRSERWFLPRRNNSPVQSRTAAAPPHLEGTQNSSHSN